MPYNDRSADQVVEYESTIGSLQTLIDSNRGCLFVFGGDFNVTRDSNATASQILWHFCNYNN